MESDGLDRFLQAFVRAEAGNAPPRPGLRPFLTISRQAGAGGHTLACAVLATLERESDAAWRGWKVFDQGVCSRIAEDPGLRAMLEAALQAQGLALAGDYAAPSLPGATPYEIVARKLFRTVRSLACAGKAVILGRAGCVVARELPAGVHVRLVGPPAWRAHRVARELGLDVEDAARWMRQQDDARRRLFRGRFRREIDDPFLYDAILDSERSSFDELASAVVALLKARAARLSEEERVGLLSAGG
ncbi:MAG: cytidylate kinase-like family protein [Elusimicrobia bacterium]|nr:cytidylate kinase-like family protein [Elusimicrobiota bacterium]